jgi:hypothetical protein
LRQRTTLVPSFQGQGFRCTKLAGLRQIPLATFQVKAWLISFLLAQIGQACQVFAFNHHLLLPSKRILFQFGLLHFGQQRGSSKRNDS